MKTIESIREVFEERLRQSLYCAGLSKEEQNRWSIKLWRDSKDRMRYQIVRDRMLMSNTELESHMDLVLDGFQLGTRAVREKIHDDR